jgi:hypothetical protein
VNIGGGLESPDSMRTSLIHGKTTAVISMPSEFYLEFTGLTMFVPDVHHKPPSRVLKKGLILKIRL